MSKYELLNPYGAPEWNGQGVDRLRGALPLTTNFDARRSNAQLNALEHRQSVDKEEQNRAL